jgi:hypothetical protein
VRRQGNALNALLVAILGAIVTTTTAVPARADEEATLDPTHVEAKRLYGEGHDHFIAGRCTDAMPLLVRANQLVPSPNAGLLIARCLVVAGKRTHAVARFAEVEREALERVHSGEARYADTAAAAAREGAEVRAQLGTVRVRIGPRSKAQTTSPGKEELRVEIDHVPAAISADGDAVAMHDPGTATVAFVDGGARRERVVQVNRSQESLVVYEPDEPPRRSPSPSPRAPPSWTVYAAGALTVVGAASFVGFGVASEVTYGRLDSSCGGHCGPDRRGEADRGRAYQTLANVGLAVALVGGALTVVSLLAR